MMTFKEYLIETALTSLENREYASRAKTDFEKLGLGKRDGSKPSEKRARQVEKRSRRARGHSEEEEEPGMPATRDRVQGVLNTPCEIGHRPAPEREFQRMKRRVRRTRGIGSDSRGAKPLDEL